MGQNGYKETGVGCKILPMIVCLLAVVTFVATSITVSGCSRRAASDNGAYYHQLEKAYVQEAREVMNEQGYFDAGVNMTRRTSDDGERIYTVKLHHSRLEKASDTRLQELMELLSNIPFEDGQVLYEII